MTTSRLRERLGVIVRAGVVTRGGVGPSLRSALFFSVIYFFSSLQLIV
jgi:hypothetical protein